MHSWKIRRSDLIFVMTRTHRDRLSKVYRPQLKHVRVVCLDIPDEFENMDPDLVRILKDKVSPHLPGPDPFFEECDDRS